MKKTILFVAAVIFFLSLPHYGAAQKSKSYRPKTVRVKSYTTKTGKHVRSYKRSRPSHSHSYFITPFVRPKEIAA